MDEGALLKTGRASVRGHTTHCPVARWRRLAYIIHGFDVRKNLIKLSIAQPSIKVRTSGKYCGL